MKPIKCIKDFTYNEKYYFKNDIIEPTKDNFEMIKKLNEKGFIEPLTLKELFEIKETINKSKFKKEED